jgi:WD40 repeat protein
VILAFNPDGSILAVGDYEGHIHIINAKTTTEIAILEGHTSAVRGLAFSHDGKLLVSGGGWSIRLWGVPAS